MSARRDRPPRPWFLSALAAVAVGVIVLAITEIGTPTSSARTSREIITAGQGVVQSTVTASGNIAAGIDVNVNFNTGGTLQDVYVHSGQHVDAGQLLADLDPTSAQLSLNQAQENLTAAEDNLSCLQGVTSDCGSGGGSGAGSGSSGSGSSGSGSPGSGSPGSGSSGAASTTSYFAPAATVEYAAFHPGTTSGTSTTQSKPGPMAPTQSKPGSAPTTKSKPGTTTTTKTTPHVTVTVIVPSTSRTGSSSSPSSGGNSSGGNSTAKTGGTSTAKTTSTATTTTTTPSPGSVASAQSAIYSAQAGVHNAEVALNNTKLYAPVSGTIASLSSLTPGDTVSGGGSGSSSSSGASPSSSSSSGTGSGTTAGSLGGSGSSGSGSSGSGFAEIVNTNTLTMTVAFSESDISKVQVGQPATVTLDALAGVELAAHVSQISLVGTASSSVVSYDATLTLDQNDSRVKPGMSASAAVIVAQAQGITIPNQAVSGSGSLAAVNLLRNGETVSQQVVVGLRGDTRTQIISGLNAGDQVVVTVTLPSLSATSTPGSGTGALGGRLGGAGGLGGGGGLGGAGGLGGGGAFFRRAAGGG